MEYVSDVKLQESAALESWRIFKITGDIYDAMEFMRDIQILDKLLEDEAERE